MSDVAATTTNGHTNGLMPSCVFPFHIADLERSGLSAEMITAAGIFSEGNRDQLAKLLNRKSWPATMGSGLVFQYRDASNAIILNRVKPDRPPLRNGKSSKYLSPTGAIARAYFPPCVHQRIADGATEVLITEGEKKALKAAQEGFCCIGLSGVDCWHPKRSTTLMPDLEISWAGRTLFIVFDSDAAENSRVLENESLLAAQTKQRGAIVKAVRLPPGPNGEKVGLDDFLVSDGPGALRRLMDTATEPDEVPPESQKVPAFEADPADVSKDFRQVTQIDGIDRLRSWRGTFWYYKRGGYQELPDDDIKAKLTEFFTRDYFQVKRADVSNTLMHLHSQLLLPSHVDAPTWLAPKSPEDWPPLECIATKSGIVHLPSLAKANDKFLVPPTPRFFTTAAVDYAFDPKAPRPATWFAFLQSLWGDDQQSIDTLQEFFGYALTPDTAQQKLLMVIGPKRSGKGTILRILRALVGSMNVAAPTLSSLCERFGLWPLLGKSLAIISDARLSGRADQAVIVERILSVTGEDAQTIDRKNLAPVTVKLPTRFVVVTNELPRLGDASGAIVSRMLLLKTSNSFYGRENHGLTDQLLAELPGIFLWAALGWHTLRQRGYFIQPESSLELLNELNDLSSPISAFVRERCDVDAAATVSVDTLYEEWRRWCVASGKVRPTDKATFGRDLGAIHPSVKRTRPRIEGEREYVYQGIGLLVWS